MKQIKVPAHEKMLREFQDVFSEDSSAETPPEKVITMRIPIKPGSKPPTPGPIQGNPWGRCHQMADPGVPGGAWAGQP